MVLLIGSSIFVFLWDFVLFGVGGRGRECLEGNSCLNGCGKRKEKRRVREKWGN